MMVTTNHILFTKLLFLIATLLHLVRGNQSPKKHRFHINLDPNLVRDIDRADYNDWVIQRYESGISANQNTTHPTPRRRRLKHWNCGDEGGKYCPNYVYSCRIDTGPTKEAFFNGGRGCLLCPLGYFAPPKSQPDGLEGYADECFRCAPGKYSDKSGLSQCKSCPTSKYQDQIGSPSCSDCLPGKYNIKKIGAENCFSCRTGDYDLFTAQTVCSTVCESFQMLVEGPVGGGLGHSKWYCLNDPPKCVGRGDTPLVLMKKDTTPNANTNGSSYYYNKTIGNSSNTTYRSTALDYRCRCGDGVIGNCKRGGYCPLINNESQHVSLCLSGEYCHSNGQCNSFPEPLLKLYAIDSTRLKLDIDMLAGENVSGMNSILDVVLASNGIPGQSQRLNFQSCLPYNVAVNYAYGGSTKLSSFKHVWFNVQAWGGSNFNYYGNFHLMFVESSDTIKYTTFVDKCHIDCVHYTYFTVAAPNPMIEPFTMKCFCSFTPKTWVLFGRCNVGVHQKDAPECQKIYTTANFTTASNDPMEFQIPWGAASVKKASVYVYRMKESQNTTVLVTSLIKSMLGFKNKLLINNINELIPECIDSNNIFCSFSLEIYNELANNNYHSQLPAFNPKQPPPTPWRPRIVHFQIDLPRQNGQIIVKSSNVSVWRQNPSTYIGGIFLSCFIKKTTNYAWKLIYQKRWSIEQFQMGKQSTRFTFAHTIGNTCEQGLYVIRCGIVGIEKDTIEEFRIAKDTISSCVQKNGLPFNLCNVEVRTESFNCTDNEYSYTKSFQVPVPPRSIFQFQKIGLSVSTNTTANAMYIRNEEDMNTLLKRLSTNSSVSDFTFGQSVFVDVALDQPGLSSLSSKLNNPLVTSRGPVEDTTIRTKSFVSLAKKGWWSVNLLPKPYAPVFEDFNVTIMLNSAVTRTDQVKVIITSSFDPINQVPSGSIFYRCGFNTLDECRVSSNNLDTATLWTASHFRKDLLHQRVVTQCCGLTRLVLLLSQIFHHHHFLDPKQ